MTASLNTQQQSYGEGEVYSSSHVLAKKLNNRGASLVNRGDFEAGIVRLKQALTLSEQSILEVPADNYNSKVPLCSCECCSLAACLTSGNGSNSNTMDWHDTNSHSHPNYQQQQQQQQQEQYGDQSSASSDHDFFVYRQLLFVDPHSIEEHDHYMGLTLSFLIILNLALAHHWQAIDIVEEQKKKHEYDVTMMVGFQRAMEFYDLAYQLHTMLLQQQQQNEAVQEDGSTTTNNNTLLLSAGVRITTLISNNLGDLHRRAGNTHKYQLCVQHLVSVLMYLLDSQLLVQVFVVETPEFEGLLRNISPLIFGSETPICASAA